MSEGFICTICGNKTANAEQDKCAYKSCPRYDPSIGFEDEEERFDVMAVADAIAKEGKPKRVRRWTAKDDGIDKSAVRGEVRIIHRDIVPDVRLKPHIANMLADAYTLVQEELLRLRKFQDEEQDKPLPISRLESLIKSLKTLQHAEIEQEKRDAPEDKDDEELLTEMLRDPKLRDTIRNLLDEYDD